MSKRRRNPWDEAEAFEFKTGSGVLGDLPGDAFYDEEASAEPVIPDEAHEALSRLLNKTHKRTKQMRGVRRKHAWQ